MYTLNIYTRETGRYLVSITQDTKNQCLNIAGVYFADYAWEWDHKNPVRNKHYRGDKSTEVALEFLIDR
jgi:hypothetical protein